MSQMKQDNRSAIAVAITQANRAIGAITLIWRRDYMSVEEFGKKYSSCLIETAHQIGKSV
jgi:DNA-binding IclR family transcriptional regulator